VRSQSGAGSCAPRRFASSDGKTLPKFTETNHFSVCSICGGGWGRAAGGGAGFRSAKTATGDGKRQRAGAIQSARTTRGRGRRTQDVELLWPHRLEFGSARLWLEMSEQFLRRNRVRGVEFHDWVRGKSRVVWLKKVEDTGRFVGEWRWMDDRGSRRKGREARGVVSRGARVVGRIELSHFVTGVCKRQGYRTTDHGPLTTDYGTGEGKWILTTKETKYRYVFCQREVCEELFVLPGIDVLEWWPSCVRRRELP